MLPLPSFAAQSPPELLIALTVAQPPRMPFTLEREELVTPLDEKSTVAPALRLTVPLIASGPELTCQGCWPGASESGLLMVAEPLALMPPAPSVSVPEPEIV